MFRLFITSLLATSLLACHSRVKTQSHEPAKAPAAIQKSKSDCDIMKEDHNPRPLVTYTSRDIERHFQRTIRSCQGRVVSDELETVKDPWGKLNIYANTPVKNPKTPPEWSIMNRRTCSGGGFHSISEGNGIRVWLDVAKAVLTFEVVPGRNIIDYTYTACESLDAETKLCDKKTQEKGSVVLDVNYREVTIPGIREIKDYCPNAR